MHRTNNCSQVQIVNNGMNIKAITVIKIDYCNNWVRCPAANYSTYNSMLSSLGGAISSGLQQVKSPQCGECGEVTKQSKNKEECTEPSKSKWQPKGHPSLQCPHQIISWADHTGSHGTCLWKLTLIPQSYWTDWINLRKDFIVTSSKELMWLLPSVGWLVGLSACSHDYTKTTTLIFIEVVLHELRMNPFNSGADQGVNFILHLCWQRSDLRVHACQ